MRRLAAQDTPRACCWEGKGRVYLRGTGATGGGSELAPGGGVVSAGGGRATVCFTAVVPPGCHHAVPGGPCWNWGAIRCTIWACCAAAAVWMGRGGQGAGVQSAVDRRDRCCRGVHSGGCGGGGIQVLYGRCCVVCLPAAWFLGALLSGLNGSNLPRVDAEGKVPLP